MIVDQVDAFKSWLTAVLKPMCEADPAALAKYVLALIKKDKTEAELRKSMVGQLEVFLEGETENFVSLVFQTLATKDYITTPVIPNANPPNPNVLKSKDGKEAKIIVQPSELPNLSEAVNGAAPKKEPEIKRDRSRRNSETEKEERVRRRSRHRSTSPRVRSRSRSWERMKKSRSREKSRERDQQHRMDREKRTRGDRPWRNKSPTRRYDRRRSRTPSPTRARSRSRSPRHSHRPRYRSSRSRSRSIEKRERRDSKDVRPDTPTADSGGGDVDMRANPPGNKRRCRDFDEKGYCMRGEMCPFDHGIDPVVLEDAALTRVLTYDLNGDAGGPLAAPLPPVAPPGVIGAPLRHPGGETPYNPQAPHMWRDGRFRGPRPPPLGAIRMPGQFLLQPPPGMQRELIPVPVVMDGGKPPGYPAGPPYGPPAPPPLGYGPGEGGVALPPGGPYAKKKPFDYGRLGPRAKNPANCSLELKKVPVGMNTITHLNNHFAKFGKIVNIQVQYEGDAEAALITFSSHAEANAAYRSTEAVLNNRFIKVFWHNAAANNDKQENVPPPAQQRPVKDRLGGGPVVVPNSNKVLNLVQPKADDADKEEAKPEITKEETKAQATVAIKKNQDLIAAQVKVNKNKDEQRKEVLKIQSDLRKRKQELLDKQLSQQKILIDKMSKLAPGPQRDVVKETIKKTQEAIEAIKKDLEQAALAAKRATLSARKTKEQAQKELLDTELDLIAKQQEGADTTDIQKKLAELKAIVGAAAASKGGRGRGRGRYVPPVIGRHLLSKNNLIDKAKGGGVVKVVNRASAAPKQHAVDHRPARLLVSGYEADEQDAVLTHFQQFGEVVEYAIDSSLPSITLNYKARKEAETAMLKGKHFQDRTLSVTWSTGGGRLQTQRSGGSSTRTALLSESEEEHLIDQSLLEGEEELGPEISEEALLQDDEEEDEEDRSWRR
ncbi:zinc finger protein swm [Cylas formicarius]|uniref:zinc finger protein swm n=1 Tax=Cylas formicarius TaxID=197179 RepID=UPI0029587520|nr:zinc finger protein swm [Cylas formicarius]